MALSSPAWVLLPAPSAQLLKNSKQHSLPPNRSSFVQTLALQNNYDIKGEVWFSYSSGQANGEGHDAFAMQRLI